MALSSSRATNRWPWWPRQVHGCLQLQEIKVSTSTSSTFTTLTTRLGRESPSWTMRLSRIWPKRRPGRTIARWRRMRLASKIRAHLRTSTVRSSPRRAKLSSARTFPWLMRPIQKRRITCYRTGSMKWDLCSATTTTEISTSLWICCQSFQASHQRLWRSHMQRVVTKSRSAKAI